MARIHLPSPDELDTEQRRVYDKVVAGPRGRLRGPLRAALYNPTLADCWQALGAQLRYHTQLPPMLSELAILVTARHCRSPFEWDAHRPEAERAGLAQSIIDDLLAQAVPRSMTAEQSSVYHFALELNQRDSVSDDTYATALALFGARALVELTALVGYYTLVAMTLNAHEIPLPDGVTPVFGLPQHDPD
ncbi:MAG: carboxymuconolactone decarboxylase family protein [Burkholderiaceae bacterium]